MNSMTQFFSEIQSNPLAMASLSILAKSSLLLLCAWAVVALQKRRSAALRHMMWTLALSCSLALLALQMTMPAWKVVPRIDKPQPAQQTAHAQPANENIIELMAKDSRPHSKPAARTSRNAPTERPAKGVKLTNAAGSADSPSVKFNISAPAAQTVTVPAQSSDWRRAAFGLWLLGVFTCAAFYLYGEWRLRKLAKSAPAVSDERWNALANTITSKLQIRREVRLLTSPEVEIPLTFGILRPVVVLPVDAMEWDTYRRQAVLLHELAHISRWDALTQTINHVACTVYWFNPLVWFAARSARYERELACDDFVLSMGAPASGYANELLTMVSGLQKRDSYAVALAMARRSQFEGRLLALLDPKQERKGMTARFAIVAGALALVLALPLAALQQQEAVPPAPPSPPAAPAAMSEPAPVPPPAPAGQSTVPPDPATPAALAPPAEESPAPLAAPALAPGPPAQPTPPPDGWTYAQTPATAVAPHAASVYGVAPSRTTSVTPVAAIAGTPAPSAPVASTRPQKAAVIPPAGRQTGLECIGSGNKSQHNSVSTNDDGTNKSMMVSWSGGDCDVSLNSRGEVKFNDDFTGIQSISQDGFVEITSRIHGESRRLSVHPSGNNGPLEYVWWMNGTKQPYDDYARKWVTNFLIELDRHSAWAVNQRFPALMKEGGVQRVLDEVSYMPSDYARSVYLRKLISDVNLKPQELNAVLARTAEMSSDYEVARTLMAVVGKYPLNDQASRNAFLAAIDVMNSDYEHARVLMAFFDKGPLPIEMARAVLSSASKLQSDYEHARVLVAMTDKGLVDANTQSDFLNSVNNIKSDYEHSRTLIAFLGARKSDDAAVLGVIKAASSINSDYERARVLTSAASGRNLSGNMRDEYVRAAQQIRSEYERNRALSAVGYRATSL